MKLSDECHSSAVTEIIQKVKEKSCSSSRGDWVEQKENRPSEDSTDGKEDNLANEVLKAIDNSSK